MTVYVLTDTVPGDSEWTKTVVRAVVTKREDAERLRRLFGWWIEEETAVVDDPALLAIPEDGRTRYAFTRDKGETEWSIRGGGQGGLDVGFTEPGTVRLDVKPSDGNRDWWWLWQVVARSRGEAEAAFHAHLATLDPEWLAAEEGYVPPPPPPLGPGEAYLSITADDLSRDGTDDLLAVAARLAGGGENE